jgi:excisionase family DNA binding protein
MAPKKRVHSADIANLPVTLSSEEVAKLKGVSNKTVIRWAQNGLLNSVKLPFGAGYRFDPAEVEAFEPPKMGPKPRKR